MNLNFDKKYFTLLTCMFAINSAQLFGAATIVAADEEVVQSSDDKKRSEPQAEAKESKQEAKPEATLVSWTEISKKKPVSDLISKSVEERAKDLPKDLKKIIGRNMLNQYWDSVSSENMEALYFALWDDSFRSANFCLLGFLQLIREYHPENTEDAIIFEFSNIQENQEDGAIISTQSRFEQITKEFILSTEFAKKYPKNIPNQVLCIVFPNGKIKWLFSDEHIALISTLTLEQIHYIKRLYLRNQAANPILYTPKLLERVGVEKSGGRSYIRRISSWVINEEKRRARNRLTELLLDKKEESIHISLPINIRLNLETNYKIVMQSQLPKLEREKLAMKCGKISLLLYLAACAPVLAYQIFFGK